MEQTIQKINHLKQSYKNILIAFLQRKNELGLYEAEQFSKVLLELQVAPEELISIHRSVLEEEVPFIKQEILDSLDFLLEVMVGYGLAYREHQSLRDRQQELESEIDIAAKMQLTLLPKTYPHIPSLDIGVISVPANKMSGDYYNYILDDHGCLGIAVADIIGKGIPAALCMSMIKYAMDSLPEQRLQPGALLENLNRVVELNVDDSMFVTMMYGSYDPREHLFNFSAAGHEPGFYYEKETDKFHSLYAKGTALGMVKKARYKEYVQQINVGDAVIFLTDGVTECRIGDRFIEGEEIVNLLKKYMHLSGQCFVESVYHDLAKLQNFVLIDDFTLMFLRRVV